MIQGIDLFFAALSAFVLALLFVPAIARIMKRCGIVDEPSARRINTVAIPRGGGIGIAIAFALGAWICRNFLEVDPFGAISPSQATGIFVAALEMLLLGLWDDARNLNPFIKLAGQIVSSATVFFFGVSVGSVFVVSMPQWLDFLCTVAWCVMVVNAFNLIDGIDGLCAGLAAIGLCGMAFCFFVKGSAHAAVPLIVLAGATLGFLCYNFNPASVFLGDSGSMFLGFMVAVLPLALSGKTVFVATMGLPVLFMGLPLFDMGLAVIRRLIKAFLSGNRFLKGIVMPDMEHLHHRLLKAGLSQRRAVLLFYGISALLVLACVALVVAKKNVAEGVAIISFVLIAALLGKSVLRVELWYGGQLVAGIMSHHRPGRKFVFRTFSALAIDLVLWALSWYWAAEMVYIPHVGLNGLHYNDAFPVVLFVMTAGFFLCRIYHRVWSRAHLRDYMVLLFAFLLGCMVSFAFVNIAGKNYLNVGRHFTAFSFMGVFFSAMTRLLERFVSQAIAFTENSVRKNSAFPRKAVVYGCKERFMMFDMTFSGSALAKSGYCIVGIIDDDSSLWNRYIHGHRCHGGIGALEALTAKSGAKHIILCAGIGPERMEILKNLAQRTGLEILEFNHSLAPIADNRKGA